jgi:hypothetical protein
MLDPGLWDTTPGEELPPADSAPGTHPFALPDGVNPAADKARAAASAVLIPTWLLVAVLLVGLVCLAVLAAVFRRL